VIVKYSTRMAGLSSDRREVLERLLGRRASVPTLARCERNGSVEASFAQRRMWILDRLLPGSHLYNETTLLTFRRELHPIVIERCLNEIVRRHETLRTTFRQTGDRLEQVIAPELTIAVPVLDLRDVPPRTLRQECEAAATTDGRRLFDLGRGPLIRALLMRGRTEWALALTLHHIVCDAWSMCVLARELAQLERTFSTKTPSCLPELAIQYADFAEWQRQVLRGAPLDRDLKYWRTQLAGLPVLQLPGSRPRPRIPNLEGERQAVSIPPELVARLHVIGREEGATLFMMLLAAFQVLLHRYSGSQDIAVGTPVANRSRKELEPLIGFFANTVVMRTDFSGAPTFRQLLAQVRRNALEAYDHQDVSFERLVEDLAPARDLSRNPLFQVGFQLFSAPRFAGLDQEYAPEARQVNLGTAKVDLRLDLLELGRNVEGYFEYSTALWDAGSIARMREHYRVLLESIAANPDADAAGLPLLTAAERRQIFAWRDGGVQTATGCVHKLFERTAARMPDAVAVVEGNTQTCFADLNRQANQLSRHLTALGVGRGAVVGVCTGRSVATVRSLLGVLKAGAAYLPLDPTYPPDRLTMLIDDGAPAVVVAVRRYAELIAGHRGPIVWLDEDESIVAKESPDDPWNDVDAHDLAYILYTSGSTGRPKGVLVEHGGAVNVAAEQMRCLAVGPSDRVLQLASVGFDASIFEMLMMIGAGATLVVAEPDELLPGRPLLRILRDRSISVLTIPPSSLAAVPEEPLPSLRLLNLAGEAAPAPLAARWAEERQLFNLYGTTEGTIWSTIGAFDASGALPIGRPIAGVAAYVLDRTSQPVPCEVPGELYIGGAGVARGYLNEPELTARKFRPDPFSSEPGGRMYATGDRARFLPDGSLEFLGRLDDQVKVRGCRVEPAEIQAALAEHPTVRQSVVVARETTPADTRLTAYVVPDADYRGAIGDRTPADWDREQVERWRVMHDATYARTPPPPDRAFNTTGWSSSYTGQPIASHEMREHMDATLARILALRPQRVLEIGCGMGLLLFRLAPGCSRYCATDVSRAALDYVEREIAGRLPQVELRHASADEDTFIEARSFDLVVLNSVVQYFPSAGYLERVLAIAARAVRPGGHVFVGDIRNLALCEAFHASVELTRATANTPADVIRRRVARRVRQDQELMVAPAFFAAVVARLAGTADVEVQLRRGWNANELTRFRYDVTMAIGAPVTTAPPSEALSWDEVGNPERLAGLLRDRQPAALIVRGVPNARVREWTEAVQWLSQERTATAADWRLWKRHAEGGLEPEVFWALEESTGYDVHIGWSSAGADRFDVLLRRLDAKSSLVQGSWQRWCDVEEPSSRQTSDPQRLAAVHRLPSVWRSYLRQRLPDYMVPAAFVLLDALPVTAHGKVDRTKLPLPDESRPAADVARVAPRTYLEQQIADVWRDVLAIKAVGIQDNFFDLGGHSLLMVRVHERLCEILKRDLSITDLFQYPSVSSLAAYLGDAAAPARGAGVADDRAGKQRSAMHRRSGARWSVTPVARNGTPVVEATSDDVIMHSRLHPRPVSRNRRPGR
jgi:amino acid adenylation domain-containing protein